MNRGGSPCCAPARARSPTPADPSRRATRCARPSICWRPMPSSASRWSPRSPSSPPSGPSSRARRGACSPPSAPGSAGTAPGAAAALTLAMAAERAAAGDHAATETLSDEARDGARAAGDLVLEAAAAAGAADAAHCRLRGEDPAALDRRRHEDRRSRPSSSTRWPTSRSAERLHMLLSLTLARLFSGDPAPAYEAVQRGLGDRAAHRPGVCWRPRSSACAASSRMSSAGSTTRRPTEKRRSRRRSSAATSPSRTGRRSRAAGPRSPAAGLRQRSPMGRARGTCSAPTPGRRRASASPMRGSPRATRRARSPPSRRSGGSARSCGRLTGSRPPMSRCASMLALGRHDDAQAWARRAPGRERRTAQRRVRRGHRARRGERAARRATTRGRRRASLRSGTAAAEARTRPAVGQPLPDAERERARGRRRDRRSAHRGPPRRERARVHAARGAITTPRCACCGVSASAHARSGRPPGRHSRGRRRAAGDADRPRARGRRAARRRRDERSDRAPAASQREHCRETRLARAREAGDELALGRGGAARPRPRRPAPERGGSARPARAPTTRRVHTGRAVADIRHTAQRARRTTVLA